MEKEHNLFQQNKKEIEESIKDKICYALRLAIEPRIWARYNESNGDMWDRDFPYCAVCRCVLNKHYEGIHDTNCEIAIIQKTYSECCK